jgi:DNA-binding SARP family transcriptional activator/streptogramin lyase
LDLEFRILGPLEVVRGGQPLPLGSPKQRALLGLLLLHANEPVRRERLIEDLWGDAAPKTVNAVLSVYLSRLRRLLVEGGGEQLLLTQAAGYALSVRPERLDARRFEALLEGGQRELAGGDAEGAAATLREALALWRGAPLADLSFEPFTQTEIARLEELRLTALETRIEADLALGRQDSLVAELETLVAAHPFREGPRAQLMLALYRSDRQAEALETYRRARRTFSDELGIEPGPRLHALERAILRHDSSLEAPGPVTQPAREEASIPTVREWPRLGSRRAVALAAALLLAIATALAAAAFYSSGGSPEPFVLAGNSVAVVDPGSATIVGEIPVGGKPAGPAFGEGSVWVGNRDDNTLLRIDPRSLNVVRMIGLGVTPTDIEVGAGTVWILSDSALLRVDPAINDVVDTVPLPRGSGRWSHMELGADAVFVCTCAGPPGTVIRIDAATTSVEPVRSPVWMIAYGESALWAITGELDTIERIDPKTNAVVETIPLARIGETHGWRYRMAAGEGAIWVLARASLWRIDSTTTRVVGGVPLAPSEEGSSLATGDGAVWVATSEGVLLRVDSDSQTVAKALPLGTLIYPADGFDAVAVGEGLVWVSVTSSAS